MAAFNTSDVEKDDVDKDEGGAVAPPLFTLDPR